MRTVLLFILRCVCILILLFVAITTYTTKTPNVEYEDKEVTFASETINSVVEPQRIVFPKAQVDAEMKIAMTVARNEARRYAEMELAKWQSKIMSKADSDFIDWYFSYYNVKRRECEGLARDIKHVFNKQTRTSTEWQRDELEKAVRNKLIDPEQTQQEFQRIAQKTMNIYNRSMTNSMCEIQSKYPMEMEDWENYVSKLTDVIVDTGTSVTKGYAKANFAGISVATIIVCDAGFKCFSLLGRNIAGVFGKAGTNIAVRNGSRLVAVGAGGTAAKAGGAVAGTVACAAVTAGMIVWDVIDYNISSKKDKPILRQNINEYIVELCNFLLDDDEYGIFTEINRMHNAMRMAM